MPVEFRAIVPKRRPLRKLGRLPTELTLLMGDLMTEAHDQLATYPPKPPESGYRRTGTLGRSWQHRVRGKTDRIEGEASSQGQIAPYNVTVQGPKQTARMRAIGWRTPKDVLNKLWPKWVQRVRTKIKEVTR